MSRVENRAPRVESRRGARLSALDTRLVSRAFSLVELLVVLAIVGLLAALLLPALSRSKVSAQTVACGSGLRQLGLATQLYWDDNAGNCFRYGGAPTNGGQLYWFGWIAPGIEGQRAFDASAGALFPYFQGRGVEICPAFDYATSRLKLKATGATYGYGYNLHLSAPLHAPPVNVSQLKRPADLALLADAAQVNTWQAPAAPGNPMLEEWYYVDENPTQPNGHFRHNHLANVEFCDGHVARQTPVPGSLDARLPAAGVGRLRTEILTPP